METSHVDWQVYEKEFGPLCPNCGCHHFGPPCGHDPSKSCRYCTRPVGALSTGGPDVCCTCEAFGVPPDVFMGHRKPYDFHAQREGQVCEECGGHAEWDSDQHKFACRSFCYMKSLMDKES